LKINRNNKIILNLVIDETKEILEKIIINIYKKEMIDNVNKKTYL
jgi:hypothetical protein